MSLFVDTSVWSLAFRRDLMQPSRHVGALRAALDGGDLVVTTGLVLQEVLQGFVRPTARTELLRRFAALPMLMPDREDHVEAAEIRNRCRRAGTQVGTIDAVLAQLCLRHELTLLTTDKGFAGMARHVPLRVWAPG